MPFVEVTTSKQEITFGVDGVLHLRRRFKVWNETPQQIYKDPTVIVHRDAYATPPNASKMPSYNDVIDNDVSGPTYPQSGRRLLTWLRLWQYTVEPIAPNIFMATAHYTNDPRAAPMGLDYTAVEQFRIVEIPYVRRVGIVSSGSSSGSATSYIPASIGLPMPTGKIKQTVLVDRVLRGAVESAGRREAGKIHFFNNVDFGRFDGVDIRLHGAQWVECTYNWTWEDGIDYALAESRTYTHGADPTKHPAVNAIYPVGTRPLDPAFDVFNTVRLLPPFHTIELQYSAVVDGIQPPMWVWRFPYQVNDDGWTRLPGSERFEWSLYR